MATADAYSDIKRITQANKDLLDIARTLLEVAGRVEDPAANAELRRSIDRLIGVSSEINGAAVNVARAAR